MSLKTKTYSCFFIKLLCEVSDFQAIALKNNFYFPKKKNNNKKNFVSKYLPGFYQHDLTAYIDFAQT